MEPSNNTSSSARGAATPPGIIDTIGRAFALLNRRPYLIWMPIALDALLWSGFRVLARDPLATISTIGPALPAGASNAIESVRSRVLEIDLLGVVTWVVPTLLTDLGRERVADVNGTGIRTVSDELGLVAILGALALSLLIGVSYFTMIGRLVSNRPAWGGRFLWDCASNAARLLAVAGLLIALLLFLFVPFALVGWGLQVTGIEPVGFLAIVAMMYVIWIALFFFFSPHAIALGVSSPFQAMRSSFQIVQRNLLSVLGLLLIVLLIRAGTPVALQIFTDTAWSVPFAIVVNAYVGTALLAATMLYYRDRSGASSPSQLAQAASN
jgi:hypothetical protein